MSNNYTLIHEEVMAEDNLTYHDLPNDIQDMIDDIEELKQEYNEYPSEKGFDVLQRKSLEIADEIQSMQEAELEDSEEEDNYDEGAGNHTPPPSYSKSSWKFW